MSDIYDDPKIRYYAEQMCTDIDEELHHISKLTFLGTVKPFDASDHIQGRLLSMLSKLVQPKLIVELGTFTGYGTYCLAEGLHPNGKIITVEQDMFKLDLIKQCIRSIADRVELINDSVLNVVSQIEESIDILFIDAAKREYTKYYENLLPKMNSGGLIIADNVLWKGEVIKDRTSTIAHALDEFNQLVAKDHRVEALILPYRDGLSIIRVK